MTSVFVSRVQLSGYATEVIINILLLILIIIINIINIILNVKTGWMCDYWMQLKKTE